MFNETDVVKITPQRVFLSTDMPVRNYFKYSFRAPRQIERIYVEEYVWDDNDRSSMYRVLREKRKTNGFSSRLQGMSTVRADLIKLIANDEPKWRLNSFEDYIRKNSLNIELDKR